MKELWGRGLTYGILKDIDFVLRQGEIVVLMGPNGGGKSTLARLISGLVVPNQGKLTLINQGQEIPWEEVKPWQEVGIIGQHPRRQTIGATVQEELSFGLLNLGWDMGTVRKTIYSLAEKMGLESKLNQSPATLSGGERQRLVLVSVLAMEPSFLILDEAMSMLDAKSQEACLNLLREKNSPIGQLWITHDPKLALLGDRLWIMDKGNLLDVGAPQEKIMDKEFCQKYSLRFLGDGGFSRSSRDGDVWENYCRIQSLRKEKYSVRGRKSLQEELLLQDKLQEENQDDNQRKINQGISTKESKESKESTESTESAESKEGKEGKEARETKEILQWRKARYDSRLYLDEVIKEKTFLAILGASGGGKTTLLESAIALLKPTAGSFRAFGQDISEAKGELRQKVRLVLQEPGEYFIGTNVYDEVFYLSPKNPLKDWFSKWGRKFSATFKSKNSVKKAGEEKIVDEIKVEEKVVEKESIDANEIKKTLIERGLKPAGHGELGAEHGLESDLEGDLDLEYLKVFGLSSDKAYAYPETLSGGERQRVALAAALESLPEVLLLDEPLLGLDAEGSEMVLDLLTELKGRLTILYVTHNLWEIEGLPDEVWLIQEGKIALQCPGEDIKANLQTFKEAGVRC